MSQLYAILLWWMSCHMFFFRSLLSLLLDDISFTISTSKYTKLSPCTHDWFSSNAAEDVRMSYIMIKAIFESHSNQTWQKHYLPPWTGPCRNFVYGFVTQITICTIFNKKISQLINHYLYIFSRVLSISIKSLKRLDHFFDSFLKNKQ